MAAASAWPGAFGYSLEKRIAPRVEVLRARGTVDAWPSLSSLLAPGHAAFAKRYAVSDVEWLAAVGGGPLSRAAKLSEWRAAKMLARPVKTARATHKQLQLQRAASGREVAS